MRPLLLCFCLLVACSPAPTTPLAPTAPDVTPSRTASPAPRPDGASLRDLPVGPSPRVGYVVGQVHVAPDGTRTRVQRGRPLGVHVIVRVGRNAFLVNDADNIEAYSTMRLVRRGRTVGEWSAYGGIVVGRDGAVGFGEATFSEADRRGPTALHLLVDDQHYVQAVRWHPDVRAVVGRELVFEYRFAPEGRTGPFVTDLGRPPRAWTRTVPDQTYDEFAREPDGATLSIEGSRSESAIVRTRRDGTRELATPLRRRLPEGDWTAYCLELEAPR